MAEADENRIDVDGDHGKISGRGRRERSRRPLDGDHEQFVARRLEVDFTEESPVG
jgi:hypothetical protein